MTGYAVIDVETTGLAPFGMHRIWEFGAVLLDSDGADEREVEFQIELLQSEYLAADHMALGVGGFDERYVPHMSLAERRQARNVKRRVLREYVAGREIQAALRDRLVIAQPALFDMTFVRALLARHCLAETWGHRAVHDLKTWACAATATENSHVCELSTDDLARITDTEIPEGRHSALVDARLTCDIARKLGAIPG